MNTRPATANDVAEVLVLEQSIFPDDAWSADMLAEGFTSEYGHYVVVEHEGAIIAYAGAYHLPGDEVADIHTIAVTPGARGNGLGAELFDGLVAWCWADGAQRILLEVRADNLIAQNLYQSRGFQTIDVREGYYQPANIDAFVMEKRVA